MIRTELVTINNICDNFAPAVEQVTGHNPLRVAQKHKRPRSEMAYLLSYIRAFSNPEADTSKVTDLLGFLHIGMISVGSEFDICELAGYHHGLLCMQTPSVQRGISACLFAGNGEQWKTALNLTIEGPSLLNEWSQSCFDQLATNDLKELFGPTRKTQRYIS